MSVDTSWVKDGARCLCDGLENEKRLVVLKGEQWSTVEATQDWEPTEWNTCFWTYEQIAQKYTPVLNPVPDWIYDRAEVIENCSGGKVVLIELKDRTWLIDKHNPFNVFRGPYSTEQIESYTREIPKPKTLNDEEMDRAKQIYYAAGIKEYPVANAIAIVTRNYGEIDQKQLTDLLKSYSEGYQDRNL